MAQPAVTVSTDKPIYAPGEPITFSWSVIDADNSTETIAYQGSDSQGNQVSGEIVVNRQDTFTMTSVRWARTGGEFAVNNGTRTATSVVPGA